MNSYLRASVLTAEQMHQNFLKDKQAWENAIAMYEGPDPLDHWWNYICWYENNGHGDPNNKFRETLERCLTLYEHSEYYKHDVRMVRLWLKYIDMQTNPLHFYQVLHQRGVGKQIACFYVSWATYYESVQAFKEAEAVYSLAFQEKAQPYAELHHAHTKFTYNKELLTQNHLQRQTAAAQQHYHQQPNFHSQGGHSQMHAAIQQYQRQQVTCQNATNPHTQTPQHSQLQLSSTQFHQQQLHPAHAQKQPPEEQQEHQQPSFQQQIYFQQKTQDNQTQHYTVNQQLQQQQQQQQPAADSIEQQTPSSIQQTFPYNYHHSQEPIQQNLEANSFAREELSRKLTMQSNLNIECNQFTDTEIMQQATISYVEVPQIRLPRKFATYCYNNHESWQPALFLEEPYDPQRICQYDKNSVYPEGAGVEFSPEELRARRYTKLNQDSTDQAHNYIVVKEYDDDDDDDNDNDDDDELYENNVIVEQQQQHQKQTTAKVQQHKRIENDNCHSEEYDESEVEEVVTDIKNKLQNVVEVIEETADETVETEDEEHEQAEHEYDYDDNCDEGGNVEKVTYSQQENTIDDPQDADEDVEDQIEASTIRFTTEGSQNKTIKIKFRKERLTGGCEASSAYTIERIYQPEVDSPTNTTVADKRNGQYSFHPYLLGQASTPKIIAKRQKSKLKKAATKFRPLANNSNSNSSSTEVPNTVCNGVGGGGGGSGGAGGGAGYSMNNLHNGNTVQDLEGSYNRSIHNAVFNDNANYSFSSAVALENSNCSLSNAVGRLNFRDATSLNNSTLNNQSNATDVSTYQENSYFATQNNAEAKERRYIKAIETIERHLAKEAIDPFNSELCRAFLTKLNFPGADDEAHTNYKVIQTPIPNKISNSRQLSLPHGIQFNVDKEIGRGSYGSVYKATDANTNAIVALKFQKPANTWEIYICDQVLKRIISPSVLPGLMDISTAIIAPNASLIATEFSPYGSLLDINNKIRQATTKVMHESLVMHFSAEICNIIEHLHQAKIIHADIKPDNFLLMRVPNNNDLNGGPSLRLIDFGCAIDMTLFANDDKEEIKFRKVIQTDGFTCIEMQEGRPWSYETDLFCIAGTIHVMLFGEYMQLQKRNNSWDIKQKLPRYLKKHIWNEFFSQMLNIKANQLPNLKQMRHTFEEEAAKMDSELQKQIRTLSNILHRR